MKSKWLNYGTLVVLIITLLAPSAVGAQEPAPSGFRALNGADAASFELPGDVRLVRRFALPKYGLTYERYQQVFGAADAEVFGGQLTLLKEGATAKYVIGAHYPSIRASNQINLTASQARQRVANDVGASGDRITTLMIHPESGRYFFQVETRRAAERWFHWIDAGNGATLNKFNAIMHDCESQPTPCGFGVQYSEDTGDVKDLSDLTTLSGGEYLLLSSDGRQETHDQGSSRRPFLGPVASDSDDDWVLLGDESPAQQALVDAHYYAYITDQYYLGVYSYDWVAGAIAAGANDKMEVHAHYSKDYNNAFWNGSYIALGDGDQVTFEELTALDVVGHELTHGVTDFTSDLIYQDETGALNEAFSDMMGSAMEFWAEANGWEPATTLEPDWYIGEDFDLRGDTVPGFRNMADPGEDGDPSHYDERYTGSEDNGGVHTNSGIANHWFYLLVNGGQNSDPTYASGTDVTGIGLAAAEPIAFLGFTALPADATFCDARADTIAVAGTYEANVADAWDEVGVDSALCGGGSDTTPPAAPTNLSASGGDGVVNLDWDDNAEADLAGYNVYRSETSGGPYTVIASGVTTSDFSDTTVTNGTLYYYVVTAVDTSDNESTYSNEASATPEPDTTPPTAPANLSASGGDGLVNLDWDDNSEADLADYNVYRSEVSGGSYTVIASGVTTSDFSDTTVTNGTTYYYVVTAVDTSDNESTYSNEASATPDISTSMHIGDLDGNSINNGSTWTAQVTITVHDASENPVSGATVNGSWSGPVSSGATCTTDSSGTCTVDVSGIHKRNSSVTFTVDSVSDTLSYDSSANHDPDGESDGTTITVAKP